jgi:hypothetical protein
MDRAAYDYAIGHLGQAHLGAPRNWAEGVPLYRGISPLVISPHRPLEETRLWMPTVNPSREPTYGRLPYGLWNIVTVLIWLLPFCVVLSQEEIDGYIARLFDKDPPPPCVIGKFTVALQ